MTPGGQTVGPVWPPPACPVPAERRCFFETIASAPQICAEFLRGGILNPLVRLLIVTLVSLVVVPSPGLAQSGALDLSQMSIENLMNIEITSASRKEQRAADVAAAVFVITRDDIRRSGMTTIADVLRLAPDTLVLATQVPRSATLRLRWTF